MKTINDTVHAFVGYPDVAVERAATGPLAGLSFGVKDIYDVAGYPTGCGNMTRAAEAKPAVAHASPVSAMLEAGAEFAGKTHTVEFAFGMDGVNEQLGTPINPAAPDRVPGGSSSGSVAAVAAGLIDTAFGSDTGGSVRVPASFCGLIGLRTTFGRIDITGTMPLAPSLDTVGWFARTGEIYDRVGAVLLGQDPDDTPLTRLMIATDGFAQLLGKGEASVLKAVLPGVEALFDSSQRIDISPDGLEAWSKVFRTIIGYEAWANHGAWIEAHPGALTAAGVARFEAGRQVTPDDYDAATVKRRAIRERATSMLGADGVIVLPAAPSIAPPRRASSEQREAFRLKALPLTCTAGLAGLPQISVPVATFNGAPIGLSLIGPAGRDRALIALARRILGA